MLGDWACWGWQWFASLHGRVWTVRACVFLLTKVFIWIFSPVHDVMVNMIHFDVAALVGCSAAYPVTEFVQCVRQTIGFRTGSCWLPTPAVFVNEAVNLLCTILFYPSIEEWNGLLYGMAIDSSPVPIRLHRWSISADNVKIWAARVWCSKSWQLTASAAPESNRHLYAGEILRSTAHVDVQVNVAYTYTREDWASGLADLRERDHDAWLGLFGSQKATNLFEHDKTTLTGTAKIKRIIVAVSFNRSWLHTWRRRKNIEPEPPNGSNIALKVLTFKPRYKFPKFLIES